MRRHLSIALAAALVAGPLSAQVSITTGSPTSAVQPLGNDSDLPFVLTALAQTFTMPQGGYFLNFVRGYLTAGFGNGTDVQLTGAIYQFDVDHLVGPALITSPFFPGSDNTSGYDQIDFGDPSSLSGVPLTPGVVYALVLTSLPGTPNHATTGVGVTDDVYSGGSLFYTTDTDLSTAAFSDAGFDAAFTATFGTPEPSELVLMATGMIGVAGVVRRRRRVSDAARSASA